MTPRNFDDFIRRDLEREIAHHERLAKKQQQAQKPPAPQPTAHSLSQVPDKPLSWLWPGRIPFGHLTLLDAAPDSGLSLLALTLAASVSSGSPLPDGTPTQQGHVLLLAPYDSPTDTLKPRFTAAGGDPTHLQLVSPLVVDPSRTFAHSRSYAFPHDLDHLAGLIRSLNARLLILDPASAIPGLSRCLPALVDLARQTTCAILLTRSLRQAPADPLHASAPSSPLLQAARSRLLLAPDPSGDGRQLLLTTKHALGTQPATLAYDIVASQADIPTIHWVGERDHDQLIRLCTGPLRSPYRRAILRFLHQSDAPQSIPTILEATSYDYEAGRRMLPRMKIAGELVSPARGLYTTAHHPCLLHFTNDSSPVPTVANVASVPSPGSPPAHSPHSAAPPAPAMPVTDPPTSMPSPVSPVSPVANVASVASLSPPSAHSAESATPPAPAMPVTDPPTSAIPSVSNVAHVPSISSLSPPPAHSPQSNRSSVSNVAHVPSIPSLSPPPVHPPQSNRSSVSNVANVPHVSTPPHRENGIGIGGDKEEL